MCEAMPKSEAVIKEQTADQGARTQDQISVVLDKRFSAAARGTQLNREQAMV
jgi:hypothetical protein